MSSKVDDQDLCFAEMLLPKGSQEQIACIKKLATSLRSGDLCVEREVLGSAIDSIDGSIVCRLDKDPVCSDELLFPKGPIVCFSHRYYLQKNWVYESYLLQLTKKLRSKSVPTYLDLMRFEVLLRESVAEAKLFASQAEAIRSTLKQSLSFICGGPGTGKTYTAGQLIRLFAAARDKKQKPTLRVCLTAPTGKAASHLRAALEVGEEMDPFVQIESSTLHRLLALQPGSQKVFSKRRIDADLVIVDESSMIDVPLLVHLFERIGDETIVILIGDPHQLPPIGMGGLFAEMSALFGSFLERGVRIEKASLQQLAQFLQQGQVEPFCNDVEPFCLDWSWDKELSHRLYQRIDPLISAVLPDPDAAIEKYSQFRVLNAVRQGPYGADRLNREIFQKVQAQPGYWAVPILAAINDPYAEIYNGMGGVLIGSCTKDAVAYFPDPGSKKLRPFYSPPPYELAFCLSVHKSQGSEFSRILGLFPEGSEVFGRECLYTALTRAKQGVEILGNQETLRAMAEARCMRVSGFTDRWTNHLVILRAVWNLELCQGGALNFDQGLPAPKQPNVVYCSCP